MIFDKRYIITQVKAHSEAVSLFDDYAKNGESGAVKDFVTTTLPTLEQHKQEINQLKSSY